jgi:hypothetical protein
MRVSIWEWLMFLAVVGCVCYGAFAIDAIEISAQPLNEHASCELLIHKNHRSQSIAILNIGYALNERTQINIGELETILGCQDCHGGRDE